MILLVRGAAADRCKWNPYKDIGT